MDLFKFVCISCLANKTSTFFAISMPNCCSHTSVTGPLHDEYSMRSFTEHEYPGQVYINTSNGIYTCSLTHVLCVILTI